MQYRPLSLPFLLACVLLAAGGCSVIPFFGDDTQTVQVNIEGQPDMNSGGNAAVVHVYQLAGETNFNRTPLSAFWKDDEAALDDELISKQGGLLYPEERKSLQLELGEKTNFVGMAADLREPDREGWRKLYPVSEVADRQVTATVTTDRLTLNVEDD